ncbi:hypothetical protein AB6N24_06245 [Cellulomonas sp. 179-A 4D5 NHS]|uniref:hypothetical protein n=1 Tax=Cellulomonas sp. 179-A 4D5 NHS TaxID=3142378 RepID=UPI00399FBA68
MSLIAVWSTFASAAMVFFAYLGCVFFAGVNGLGQVEWWAWVLAPWQPIVDIGVVAASAALTIAGYAMRPRS